MRKEKSVIKMAFIIVAFFAAILALPACNSASDPNALQFPTISAGNDNPNVPIVVSSAPLSADPEAGMKVFCSQLPYWVTTGYDGSFSIDLLAQQQGSQPEGSASFQLPTFIESN